MDIADEAAKYNEQFHRVAMDNHFASRPQADEQPLLIDGKRCCLDCEEPIDPRRLAAKPDAVRCTECASKKETLWKR